MRTERVESGQTGRTATVRFDPTPDEFADAMRASGLECRAAVCPKTHELAMWGADDALHSCVDDRLGTADWIGFVFHRHAVELTDDRVGPSELRRALRASSLAGIMKGRINVTTPDRPDFAPR